MQKTFVFFLCCFFSLSIYAQTAKVIAVKGNVQLKEGKLASWKKAKVNVPLGKDAQIKTGQRAECSLAFDEALKNVLTLKENSHLALSEIQPVNISLGQGKVFALIDDVSAVGKFEIRTPTAIAGVRGTGESVDANNQRTEVKCFRDSLYVNGLDAQGNPTGEQILNENFGLDVGLGGALGEPFRLSDADRRQWQEFEGNLENLRKDKESSNAASRGSKSSLEDLRQDLREDYRQEILEQERRNEEEAHRIPGNNS